MRIRMATFDEAEQAGLDGTLCSNLDRGPAFVVEADGVKFVAPGPVGILGTEEAIASITIDDDVAESYSDVVIVHTEEPLRPKHEVPRDVEARLAQYEDDALPMRELRIVRTYWRTPGEWTLVSYEVGREPYDFNEGGEPCVTHDQFRNWIAADWKYHLGLTEEEHAFVVQQYYDLVNVEEQRLPRAFSENHACACAPATFDADGVCLDCGGHS